MRAELLRRDKNPNFRVYRSSKVDCIAHAAEWVLVIPERGLPPGRRHCAYQSQWLQAAQVHSRPRQPSHVSHVPVTGFHINDTCCGTRMAWRMVQLCISCNLKACDAWHSTTVMPAPMRGPPFMQRRDPRWASHKIPHMNCTERCAAVWPRTACSLRRCAHANAFELLRVADSTSFRP